MCVMAAPAAMALMAVSTAMSVAGTIMSAQASSNAATYQAAVAQRNAEQADRNASYARQAGAIQEQNQRLVGAGKLAGVKAAEASSGFDLNQGSALDLQAGQATVNELDALTIRNKTAREAYGYQTQSDSFRAQGAMDTATASNAMTAGVVGAIGNVVGGASSLAGKYAQFSQTGLIK